MLGLRYYDCPACDRVSASPEEPSRCPHCAATSLRELTGRLQRDAYFTRGFGEES